MPVTSPYDGLLYKAKSCLFYFRVSLIYSCLRILNLFYDNYLVLPKIKKLAHTEPVFQFSLCNSQCRLSRTAGNPNPFMAIILALQIENAVLLAFCFFAGQPETKGTSLESSKRFQSRHHMRTGYPVMLRPRTV